MKKIVILVCFLLTLSWLSGNVQAQDRHQSSSFKRIESEKIAFITKELQLTPKEAEMFFPIYNQYRDEIMDLLHADRSSNHSRNNKSSQPRNRMDELAKETALLNIKKQYREKFNTIIGASRSSRFFEVEREFRDKLLNELRRREKGSDYDDNVNF